MKQVVKCINEPDARFRIFKDEEYILLTDSLYIDCDGGCVW